MAVRRRRGPWRLAAAWTQLTVALIWVLVFLRTGNDDRLAQAAGALVLSGAWVLSHRRSLREPKIPADREWTFPTWL